VRPIEQKTKYEKKYTFGPVNPTLQAKI